MNQRTDEQQYPQSSRSAKPDPFAAVPLIADNVEARVDSQGGLQLRRLLPQGSGLRSFLAERLGMRRPQRVNLDRNGALFWRQIDGRRNLREIESIVRHSVRLEPEESEQATILFTKMLMTRNLIYLKLPDNGERS